MRSKSCENKGRPCCWIDMAQGSAKRIHSENQKTLWFILQGNCISLLVHAVLCWAFGQVSWWRLVPSSVLEWVFYGCLRSWGASSFSEGKLDSAGMDLNASGLFIVQYMMDYLYITWFVHALSPIWSMVWWTYLVIPLYLLVKAATLVLTMGRGSPAARKGTRS
jgi:hypothetical protein